MAGFKAESVVEALDYDFNPYVKVSGTIPEPTDRQIADFFGDMKTLFKEIEADLPTGIDLDSMSSVMEAMDDLDTEVTIKITGKMCVLYAKLCSGTPTEQQIRELPPRIRQIFFNWLQQEVMAPEAVTGAGQTQVTPLRSARAG